MVEVLTEKEFNEFIFESNQGSFFQTTTFGDFKKLSDWNYYLLGLKVDGKIKCASLVLGKKVPLIGKYLYYAPRGFIIDYKNYYYLEKFTKEVKQFLKKKKGIYLTINPNYILSKREKDGKSIGENNRDVIDKLVHLKYVHSGYTKKCNDSLEPRFISKLDLKDYTEDILLENISSEAKLKINNSYKHSLNLIEIDKSRMSDFKKIIDLKNVRSLEYYNKFYDTFVSKDMAKFMIVELDLENCENNLKNQKQETLLKIAEAKSINKDSVRLLDLGKQVELLEKRINVLNKLRSEKGDKIVTSGALYISYKNELVSLFSSSNEE